MSWEQDEHNRGQEDGSNASAFDEIVENFNLFSSTPYKEGFRNGVLNQDDEE